MQHLKLRRNGLFVAPALRVACIIFFLSFLWIFFSDRAIALLTDDPLKITRFQTIKGWIYISLISIIIFFLVKREIGQRDKLIGLLNESREWYNLLIANLPGVDVMLFDQDGSILLTHCEHLVGKQLISPHHPNDRIGSVISNEDLKSMVFSTMESVANKQDIIEEIRIGEQFLRLYGTPLVSSGGKLVAGMIIFQDTTDQHQILNEIITKRDQYEGLYEEHLAMENELRHVNTELMSLNRELVTNEEKYRLFFENINDAAFIYEFDKDLQEGKFLEVNNIMASQLEYSTEELLLANLQAIFWDTEEIENAISTLLNGQKKLKFDTFLRSKSDRAIPAEISFYLTEFSDMQVLLSIVRNNEERHKFIDELSAAKQKAEGANHLKEVFLANMSHEIRTPLNGILGFSRILASGDMTREKIARYVSIIKNSSSQLLQIINDILDLSKIETGQLNLFSESIDSGELFEEVRMFAEEALANSEKKLELQIENKFPEAENIVTDRTKLLRIITILIDNAIKFTDAGHVSYSCGQEKNGWFHFSVTDTGIGIPDDKISTIFDNFTQADGSSNREYGGNGVGLAIVRGLVYFLGGTIHVKSEYGKGTQFDCHIPLSP